MHQLLIYYKYRKNTYQYVQNLYFIHYFATKISITFLAIKQPEVSGIPALHHLHAACIYVCFRVWVPDSASVLQNWPNESLVGSFLDRCWCSTEIPLGEGTSVVGLLCCLVDVLRPCTVLVESHSKVLCCISHLQYMPVDVVLGDDRRWLPCDSQKLTLLGMKTHQPPTLPGLQRIEVCLEVFGVLLRVFVNQTISRSYITASASASALMTYNHTTRN